MITQVRDTAPGVVGNCIGTGAFTVAWMTTNVLPWLHILSVLVGILASAGTAGYYFVAWRQGWHKKSRRGKTRRK